MQALQLRWRPHRAVILSALSLALTATAHALPVPIPHPLPLQQLRDSSLTAQREAREIAANVQRVLHEWERIGRFDPAGREAAQATRGLELAADALVNELYSTRIETLQVRSLVASLEASEHRASRSIAPRLVDRGDGRDFNELRASVQRLSWLANGQTAPGTTLQAEARQLVANARILQMQAQREVELGQAYGGRVLRDLALLVQSSERLAQTLSGPYANPTAARQQLPALTQLLGSVQAQVRTSFSYQIVALAERTEAQLNQLRWRLQPVYY